MEKYNDLDKRSEKIFQIIVNIIAGISSFYYLLKIGQPLNDAPLIHSIILIIFAIKFIMDLFIFKIGYASFSLLLLFLPVISILGYGPIGEVQPLFNDSTLLIEKHFYILAFAALFFYYVWSSLLYVNKKSFLLYDAEALKKLFGNSHSLLSTWFFSLLAIAASIIYLPDLPGKAYHDLSESLLPGNAWNSVVVVSYFFVLVGVKGSMIRKLALFFVPFWLLTHYARVDILGLVLLMYLIITTAKKGKAFKPKVNFRKIGILVIGILVFSYLGLVRHSGLVFDTEAILNSLGILINYPTVQDLIYSTAAAIEVNHQSGNYYTLINYIPQLMPSFFGQGIDAAPHIVASEIHTNYGLLVYGEYYLNYRILGLFLAPFVTYAVVFLPAYLLKRGFGNLGFTLGYYLILTTTPRIMWYGYIYYLKPLVMIVPVFLLLHLIITNIEKEITVNPAVKYK
ncbi:hypothetical protein [Planococcus salinus]|uniref:O-antigen polysaccharide polymerase Wzy n=1 Tax=Planococcus salinus TaxID=1848460 RepID=A0A3M8P770_9BACL|nr:hypothetical protein [Planococcus salinus]RNF39516.1 hypothetical protein EEX84_08555 [Planococcus salinus]